MVVRNVGPLQTACPLEGDLISNRGFNALVFGAGRLPTHLLKVRPVRHASFRSEAEVTVRLSESPELRGLVPSSRTFVCEPARVLAEAFLDGPALDLLLRRRHRRDWATLAAEVLQTARPMWDAIASVVRPSHDAVVDQSSLMGDLDALRPLGLAAEAAKGLARFMEAVPRMPRPQHGDFWPRNVLKGADGWKVLDFENCGSVMLPLYDVFHMIRGCGEAAGVSTGRWVEQWAESAPGKRNLAAEVRRASGVLDIAAIESALAAYLVAFAARLHRRGIARQRIVDRIEELNSLPDLLRRGVLRRLLE